MILSWKTRVLNLFTDSHEPESYTPLTTEHGDRKQSKDVRVSVYEDGRSANHTSEIDYEVNKTSERKVDTPDLIKKSGESAKENNPSRDINSKENATLESIEVADDTEDISDAVGKNVDSYLEILPDETEGSDSVNADDDGYEFDTSDNKRSRPNRAEGQITNDYDDTTLNRKDQNKDSSRCHSSHCKSGSDYETVRSSQMQSSVIDINDDDSFYSDFDDLSESSYANVNKFLDDVEYWNAEWTKSFQALQQMFQPKNKVWNLLRKKDQESF